MEIRRQLLLSSLFLAILLSACGSKDSSKEGHKDEHAHNEANHHDEDEVMLSKDQMEQADIRLGRFRNMHLASTIKATGRLELPPQNEASVGAMMGGIVEAIQVLPGAAVEKGEVLGYLKHPDIVDLQERYLENQSELNFVKKDLERKKALYQEDVGSAKEYQQVESHYKSLKAKVNAQASKLQLLNINPDQLKADKIQERVAIKAPIGGYIRDIHVKTGQHVKGDAEMFHIVDNHHIHIDLMVYEQDVPKIREGQRMLFTLPNQENGTVMEAKIFALGKAMEHNQKSVRMHAEMTNQYDHLLPGMYVEGQVITDSTSGNVIPEGGVVMHDNHHYIFIKKQAKADEITFERIEVRPVTSNQGLVQVKGPEELDSDPEVVTHRAHYLLREMQKGSGGGHSH